MHVGWSMSKEGVEKSWGQHFAPFASSSLSTSCFFVCSFFSLFFLLLCFCVVFHLFYICVFLVLLLSFDSPFCSFFGTFVSFLFLQFFFACSFFYFVAGVCQIFAVGKQVETTVVRGQRFIFEVAHTRPAVSCAMERDFFFSHCKKWSGGGPSGITADHFFLVSDSEGDWHSLWHREQSQTGWVVSQLRKNQTVS